MLGQKIAANRTGNRHVLSSYRAARRQKTCLQPRKGFKRGQPYARPLARCTQVMLRPRKMHQKFSSLEHTQHGRAAIQHLSFKVHVLR